LREAAEYGTAVKKRVFTSRVKEVHVAGDLHGDYDMFRKIMEAHKKPEKGRLLLFLGDYADRGPGGVEIIDELNSLLEKREDIVALKGNHELYQDGNPQFSPCDLISEAEQKYGSWESFFKDIFSVFLDRLYIAAIINRVLFVHAGVFSGQTLRTERTRLICYGAIHHPPGESI
jgi:predicted MPP superfamily phosphohydrolase